MNAAAGSPRILVIHSNVYFSKRIGDALRREGFDVVPCTSAAYALTMLEWDTPSAILCATNLREMGAFQMAQILRADAKNARIPIFAVGDSNEQVLLEAYRAGCDDLVSSHQDPAAIAAHVRNFLRSRELGFRPTQMLTTSEMALSGSLSHLDLPGVIQMLGQARQTGALHINAGETDGVVFLEAGTLSHAECGERFGDEAVMEILKTCHRADSGVYKFIYGATAANRTVLRSATDLMLHAMAELDETARDCAEKESP
jgi:CheY-like chemotaxis protein